MSPLARKPSSITTPRARRSSGSSTNVSIAASKRGSDSSSLSCSRTEMILSVSSGSSRMPRAAHYWSIQSTIISSSLGWAQRLIRDFGMQEDHSAVVINSVFGPKPRALFARPRNCIFVGGLGVGAAVLQAIILDFGWCSDIGGHSTCFLSLLVRCLRSRGRRLRPLWPAARAVCLHVSARCLCADMLLLRLLFRLSERIAPTLRLAGLHQLGGQLNDLGAAASVVLLAHRWASSRWAEQTSTTLAELGRIAMQCRSAAAALMANRHTSSSSGIASRFMRTAR